MNLQASSTQDLLQRLIMNKADPIHNLSYNQEISAFGTVTPNAINQITPSAPMAMLNPQLNGNIRTPQIVQPRNVVMTKYDNKRKNTTDQIALYDWRNNTSLNNEGKVPANYYQEKLTKSAKDKVRTKQMMDGYSTQYNEFSTEAITPKSVYDTTSLQKTDANYVLNYSDLSERSIGSNLFGSSFNVNSPSYNPLLPKSAMNKPTDAPSFADERITHGNSNRPYTSKGDRLLQARELATSEYIKERQQLQNEAQQALTGAVKAPRMANPNIGIGIKSQYYETENKLNNNTHKIKGNNNPIQNVHNLTHESYNNNTIETAVRYNAEHENNNDFKKEYDIKERFGPTDKSVDLNLYSGRSSDLTKRSRLNQQRNFNSFQYIDSKNQKIQSPTTKKKSEIDREYKNETFLTKLIEGFKSFFDDDSSSNRREIKEDKFNSRYYDDEQEYEYFTNTGEIDYDKYVSEYNKQQHRHNYWVVQDDTKFEFNTDDGVYKHSEIKEAVSVLQDEENINRNVVIRDVDAIKVYQRKDNIETGEVTYNVVTIPSEYLDKPLKDHIFVDNRKQVKSDDQKNRFSGDIVELSYEDHIKIGQLTEAAPDDFKYESKDPISYHQRMLLDQLEEIPTNIITNVDYVDDYLHNKFKTKNPDMYFNRDEVKEGKINRDYIENDNNKQTNYHIQFDNHVERPHNQNQKMGIKVGQQMDPRNITSRFNQD